MTAAKTGKAKDNRFNIRASAESKVLITRAAEKENKSVSDFVLENALSAAESVLADDAHLSLNNKRWKRFLAALDAPPRKIPALRKLLTGRTVFDGK